MKKGLKLFDIVAFAFSAIFVLDSFAAAAAIGWQSIIYWIVLAIIFFVPYGLISAELGSTYKEGGIYTWVKRAFGGKWAARTNWFYWLNVGLWMSSVYIVFSSTLNYVFFPDDPLSIWVQLGIAMVITVITVAVGLLKMKYIKHIPNISSISKVIVTLALIAAMITWLAQGNGVATSITDPDYGIVPSWSQGIVFIPVIIYNLCGFELSSNTASEMKNPKRDIPLSALIAGVTIIIAYLVGTIAVNVILDVKTLDVSNGLIQTFMTVFPNWLNIIIAILIMFTLFGNMMTWTMGSNRAIQEAALDGEFPKIFASSIKKTDAPLGAGIISGIVCIVCLVLAGALSTSGEISDIFWQLYSFSSVIFLLPYILIFPSFLILRKKDKDIERVFKIKGNRVVQYIMTIVPLVIVILSIILFLFGEIIVGSKTFAWDSGGGTITFSIVGTFISIVVGEVLIYFSNRKKEKNNNDNDESELAMQSENVKTVKN